VVSSEPELQLPEVSAAPLQDMHPVTSQLAQWPCGPSQMVFSLASAASHSWKVLVAHLKVGRQVPAQELSPAAPGVHDAPLARGGLQLPSGKQTLPPFAQSPLLLQLPMQLFEF
jgi:hypothetical protein